jgi:hypothetical protein
MSTCTLNIKGRAAFHVDKKLKDAAKKAARVFAQEEKELKESNLWKNLKESGSL